MSKKALNKHFMIRHNRSLCLCLCMGKCMDRMAFGLLGGKSEPFVCQPVTHGSLKGPTFYHSLKCRREPSRTLQLPYTHTSRRPNYLC